MLQRNATHVLSNPCPRSAKGKFFGVVRRNYVKSTAGAAHGISSLVSLILGNFLFFQIILGFEVSLGLRLGFHVSSFVSGSSVLLFFWDQVQVRHPILFRRFFLQPICTDITPQPWMLSRTTAKEKGLSPEAIKKFNQVRGVVSVLLAASFPLVTLGLPASWLRSKLFSVGLSVCFLYGGLKAYELGKGYNVSPFLVFAMYGFRQTELALTILIHGSVQNVNETYPNVLPTIEKHGACLISCVQLGFLFYFLYSRRLVSKELAQTCCRYYHPAMALLYYVSLLQESWWVDLPFCMWSFPMVASMAAPFKFVIQPYFLSAKGKRADAEITKDSDHSSKPDISIATPESSPPPSPNQSSSPSVNLAQPVIQIGASSGVLLSLE